MTAPSSDSELDKILDQVRSAGYDYASSFMTSQRSDEIVVEAKVAINQYIAQEIEAVIGGDNSKFDDVPDYAMMKPVYHVRNTLRAEQRTRATQRGYKMKGATND